MQLNFLPACCYGVCVCCVCCAGSVLSSNTTSQQVTLQFPQAMPMQPLIPVLKLKFNYTLEEALDGFYRSTYIGKSAKGTDCL